MSVGETLAPGRPIYRAGGAPNGASLLDLVDDRTRELVRKRHGTTRRRGWLVRRALAVVDVTGILLAFAIAELLFAEGTRPSYDRIGTGVEIAIFALTLPGWVVLARLYGLYSSDEERADHSTVDDFFGVFNMITVGAWLFYAVANVVGFADPSFPKLATFWALAVAIVPLGRTVARSCCRRCDAYVQNTVVVGAGDVGQRVARKLLQHPEYGVNVVGFVDEQPRDRIPGLGHLTVLGSTGDLREIVSVLDVQRVIVAFSQATDEHTLELVRELNHDGVQVDVVPRLFEVLGPHASIHAAEGLTLIGLPPPRLPRSALLLKRAMDLVLSIIGLALLLPLFFVTAVAIKLDSRGPVFFRQVRMGRGERPFEILKLRTMVADADSRKSEVAHLNKHADGDNRMFKAANDPRMTRVGRFLRRYSLDELPQLLNVVRGDMSLVGPRPLIPEEHCHVQGWGARRLDLKPGLTGLWQVLGRDDIPFGEMVGLDYRYVTTWSIGRDVQLMIKTVPALARRSEGLV